MRAGDHLPEGEQGFSLIELLVLVAILVIIAGSAYETLAQRPAQIRSTVVTFAGLVAEARSLASVTGDATLDGGSGATIAVVRDGDGYVATLYAYRPIWGAAHMPAREPNIPPLRSRSVIGLVTEGGVTQAPFAIFISASGHASAQADYTVGVSAALRTEPDCRLETGIVLEFSDPTQSQAHAISCEMAQLDVTGAGTRTASTVALPQRIP